MISTMMQSPLLLDGILEHAGTQYPDTEIVSSMPDRSLHRHTYADFYRRSKQLAQALAGAGLQREQRVATLMWNHYAHLEAYFGIPGAGGVLHTMNLRLPPDDIAWIANHAEDRFLIVDDVLLPLYEKFVDQVNFERVFVVSLTDAKIPDGMESYEAFIGAQSGDFACPVQDENDGCGMCYTSGTTGNPKGVVYSHRSSVLHALASALPNAMSLSHRDCTLPVVPMFHANAWGLPYGATMCGAKQVLPGPHLDAESLLNLCEQEQATLAAGVPTIWMGIIEALEAEPTRWQLQPMRMVVGGSAVPESMIRRFDPFDLTIVQAWGLTESSPLASTCTLKPALDSADQDSRYARRATAGFTAPFVGLRIVDDDGRPLPWNGEDMGEIQLCGPWITGAYYNLDAAADKFTDGWFCTGDIATVDAQGYVNITDRSKDVIKSGGEWISSVHLENEIMAHKEVLEAAVIAHPHPKWGERPLACVVRKPGTSVSADDIISFLRSRMEKWMLPEAVVFIDEVPRTSTGKFHKLTLRKQFEDWNWEAA
ncbi:MAG: long-chain fatty acid--CoA ligase [Salinisphaera sp.]|nr:long-chain fatty acid--CoA ligase [Salinisphaera sp.]